ncbi:unnamed protein product, partial [Mycena citricolor]
SGLGCGGAGIDARPRIRTKVRVMRRLLARRLRLLRHRLGAFQLVLLLSCKPQCFKGGCRALLADGDSLPKSHAYGRRRLNGGGGLVRHGLVREGCPRREANAQARAICGIPVVGLIRGQVRWGSFGLCIPRWARARGGSIRRTRRRERRGVPRGRVRLPLGDRRGGWESLRGSQRRGVWGYPFSVGDAGIMAEAGGGRHGWRKSAIFSCVLRRERHCERRRRARQPVCQCVTLFGRAALGIRSSTSPE